MGDLHLPALSLATVIFTVAFALYGSMWLRPRRWAAWAATGAMVVGLLIQLYILGARWVEAGRPPFKTLHESLVLLTLCVALLYVLVEGVYRLRALGLAGALGCIASNGYAIAQADQEIVQLPAALQSGWFIPHVLVYFVAYAALFLGTALAGFYLVRPNAIEHHRPLLLGPGAFDLALRMDQAVRLGFALLTVGLFMGAAWAKVAWGDYWVWDPKENWSLVSWLIFAIYLHLDHIQGWTPRGRATVVVIGFAAVIFTYLGMSMLPTADQSAHVYQ